MKSRMVRMENIHERIRELRKAERLSQAELGERVGIGRVGITKLEQGQRPISVEEAYALAQALSVSIIELLGETQPEDEQEERVELRFEVTVKHLPSKDTKTKSRIEQLAETDPELQRLLDADPTLRERLEDWHRKSTQMHNEIISKGAEKQGRTRLTGKDLKVTSKRRAKQ
jgi:putative transcriptional regulator